MLKVKRRLCGCWEVLSLTSGRRVQRCGGCCASDATRWFGICGFCQFGNRIVSLQFAIPRTALRSLVTFCIYDPFCSLQVHFVSVAHDLSLGQNSKLGVSAGEFQPQTVDVFLLDSTCRIFLPSGSQMFSIMKVACGVDNLSH